MIISRCMEFGKSDSLSNRACRNQACRNRNRKYISSLKSDQSNKSRQCEGISTVGHPADLQKARAGIEDTGKWLWSPLLPVHVDGVGGS